MKARLRELSAMLRAYPPGKRVRVVIPLKDIDGTVQRGDELRVVDGAAAAEGRVVGLAAIVEVTLPEADAPVEIVGQEALL